MKTGIRILLSLIAIILASCSSSSDPKTTVGSSIGQPSEVLLVLDPAVMATSLKDSLKDLLECDVPGLNQSEHFFRVSRVPQSIYKGEMKKMHSKLLVKVDPNQETCDIQVAHDVDAHPQILVLLTCPSTDELRSNLRDLTEKAKDLLLDYQLQMRQSYLRRRPSKVVLQDLKAMGFEGFLPEEIAWTKKGRDFLWGSSRTSEKQQNFVFYHYPSDGQELDDLVRMVQIRDSVMQKNIPGGQPGQCMETTWEQEAPVADLEKCVLDGREVSILRGLWDMRNGAMGGPFVSYQWYDGSLGCVVVAEGFVYSPSTDKRDLMRHLEAGLRTVRRLL